MMRPRLADLRERDIPGRRYKHDEIFRTGVTANGSVHDDEMIRMEFIYWQSRKGVDHRIVRCWWVVKWDPAQQFLQISLLSIY